DAAARDRRVEVVGGQRLVVGHVRFAQAERRQRLGQRLAVNGLAPGHRLGVQQRRFGGGGLGGGGAAFAAARGAGGGGAVPAAAQRQSGQGGAQQQGQCADTVACLFHR